MRQGDGCSGCCPKGSGLVDSDGESEADVDNGVNGDAEYDIEGQMLIFGWKKTMHSAYAQHSCVKCSPRGNQRVRLMEHAMITLKRSMKRTILMSI
jgi:hypothetical protein